MPLPHFHGPSQGKSDYVYKDLYEVIFIYNDDIHDLRLVESISINFDKESDDKKLKLSLRDSFDLDHNFGDVDIILIDVYNATGAVKRRMVFSVELSKYNQEFSQKEQFEKYLEDISIIEVIFNVNNYDVVVDDYLGSGSIQNFLRDHKINKILK